MDYSGKKDVLIDRIIENKHILDTKTNVRTSKKTNKKKLMKRKLMLISLIKSLIKRKLVL